MTIVQRVNVSALATKVIMSESGVPPPSPLLTDLVSYWKLDEVGGERSDSHSTNNLTDNNTVASIAGKISLAIDNVKVDQDYLNHVDNAELNVAGNQDFTVAFWFWNEAANTTDAWVTKYTGGGTNQDQYLVYYANGARFIIRAVDNTAVTVISSLGILAPGAWRFIVCWRDGVNANLQIDNGIIDSQPWIKDTKNSAVDFRIGRFGAASYSNSRIDEVGLWKRTLTIAERAELWNGGAGLTYPF